MVDGLTPADALALPVREGAAAFVSKPTNWPLERKALIRYFLRDIEGRRVSMAALARRTGLSAPTLFNFLHGHTRNPSLRTGLLIARGLGISPWRVLAFHKRTRAIPREYERNSHKKRLRYPILGSGARAHALLRSE